MYNKMYLLQSVFSLCLFLSMFMNVYSQEQQQLIYVYAYSWTPGFCYNQNYPGCESPQSYWKTNFTIHGLWPQYAVNGYPASCTTEPFDAGIPQQIGINKMIEYWPDVQYDINSSSYDSFWQHEWSKHGTCSGLSQLDYFERALSLTNYIPTPEILQEYIGKNMNADTLRNAFGGADYVALQCNNQILNGAYTCWGQNDHIPSLQIACPASVVAEDTCKSSSVITIPRL